MTATWLCRDGRAIPVVDMEDKHICNVVRFVQRHTPRLRIAAALKYASYIASDPPDGALLAVEGELNALDRGAFDERLLVEAFPALGPVLVEGRKRKLIAGYTLEIL